MKYSSKTLQNLLYFMYKKTRVVFFVFHFMQVYIFPYECPGVVSRKNEVVHFLRHRHIINHVEQ